MSEYTFEQVHSLWSKFLHSPYGEKYCKEGTKINNIDYYGLAKIIDLYPDCKSLYIDWYDLDKFSPEFADYILTNPDQALERGMEAIKEQLPPDFHERYNTYTINLRILNLPENLPLHGISVDCIDKLIQVEGVLRKITEIYSTLKVGVYKCVRCGTFHRIDQDIKLGGSIEKQPLECAKELGGCGRASTSTVFKRLDNESEFINTEKFELQDLPEGAFGAKLERKVGYLFDDLTGKLQPGDRVKLTAITRINQQFKRNTTPSTEFRLLLQINALEITETAYEAIQLTDEDIVKIKRESENPELIYNLVQSIAPAVYGDFYIKLAIALQLFGGVEIVNLDGTKMRGDIHILMVGDPATAKTQILIAISELAPRGLYVQGRQTTAAGLTAAAVKDQFSGERWSLEAGAMVLADKGTLCISDFQNMSEEDRTAMHDALEQQVVSIAKAGITAKLNARCSVLADANPKYGRWSSSTAISEQIGLTPSIISRFDAIFIMADKPDLARDTEIAQHILASYSRADKYKPYYERDFLRKYIAYAKTIAPKLEENGDAFKLLKKFYLETRSNKAALEEGVVTVTPRQLGGLIRCAFASARARLSEVVELEDAERSIQINSYYLRSFVNEAGIPDIDLIASGYSSSQRDLILKLTDIIRELEEQSGNRIAEESDILMRLSDQQPERVKNALEKLVRDGHLYRPMGKEKYRLV